jgi:nucleotide-binding universal stress UspA family protein
MLEVCVFTALLGLAMHALPGLVVNQGDVDAPGHRGVRDYMLRYMAEVFAGSIFGPVVGKVAGWVVSVVIGVLLLSAVNTAIVGLIAILFMMSRDGELPASFEKLNGFGVPTLGLLVSTLVPAFLVIAVRDVSGLADLYAVGVVGAIATNLGSTSTDRSLRLEPWERVLMFSTFILMSAIEITLFAVKPNARVFCAAILSVGLILHGLAAERARKRRERAQPAAVTTKPLEQAAPALASEGEDEEFSGSPMICAVRGIGRTLDFALEEARSTKRPLYLLFVREQPVLLPEDRRRKWYEDDEARAIFAYASERAKGIKLIKLLPCYAVSDSAADTIVEVAATVGASYLILGAPQRSAIVNLLRGNIIRNITDILPEEIHLLVYA